MLWIPCFLVGLFFDVANIGLIHEYRKGHPSSPIAISLPFYVLGIVCAGWFTSHGPEWIGIWTGAVLVLIHFFIRRFWFRGKVVLKQNECMKQAENESDADYYARLNQEEKRTSSLEPNKTPAPWL